MSQFTKGKWYAGMEDRYGPYVYAVNGKEDTIIAIIRISTYSSDQFSDDEVIAIKKANARLIAEAPIMYDLLNKAFHVLGKNAANDGICREIDECLSRIDGVPVRTEEGE